jgi:SAM-dependent methyltransferase
VTAAARALAPAPDVITWYRGRRVPASCSVCGASVDAELVLAVNDAAPPHALRQLHRCPDCDSLFMLPRDRVAYENATEAGFSVKFYVEKGAGIDVMLAPLARVPFSAATRYLEIGCSFGFSLDFLRWRHGLAGIGVDPSPLAAAGRAALGLDVRSGYFDAALAARLGPQDVIYCSELIEHVDDPAAFLRVAAAGLAPDGMLVLTTPSVEAVAEGNTPTTVLAALSPGAHLAVFSRDGLGRLLDQAGLHHHVIEQGPETTIVWAKAGAPPALVAAPDDLAAALGAYFEDRLARCADDPALASGFIYRAFKQWMITGATDRAAALLPRLRDHFRDGYAIDLDAPETWPAPDGRDVRAFIDRAPLNLPVVANHLGVWLLNHARDPHAAARMLVAASSHARRYHDILAREHIADGELNATAGDAARAALIAMCQIPPVPDASGWIRAAVADIAGELGDDPDLAVRGRLASLALAHGGDEAALRDFADMAALRIAAGDAEAAAIAVDLLASVPHERVLAIAASFDAAAAGNPDTIIRSGRLPAYVRFLTGLGIHRCNAGDPVATRQTVMRALAWHALLDGREAPAAPLPPPVSAVAPALQAGLVDLLVALARQQLGLGGDIEEAGAILAACAALHPDCADLLALQRQLMINAWLARFAEAPLAAAGALTAQGNAGPSAPVVEAVFRQAVFTGQYEAAALLAPLIEPAIAAPPGEDEAGRLPLLVAWAYHLLNGRRDYPAAHELLARIESAGGLGDWAGPVSAALAITRANGRG